MRFPAIAQSSQAPSCALQASPHSGQPIRIEAKCDDARHVVEHMNGLDIVQQAPSDGTLFVAKGRLHLHNDTTRLPNWTSLVSKPVSHRAI